MTYKNKVAFYEIVFRKEFTLFKKEFTDSALYFDKFRRLKTK